MIAIANLLILAPKDFPLYLFITISLTTAASTYKCSSNYFHLKTSCHTFLEESQLKNKCSPSSTICPHNTVTILNNPPSLQSVLCSHFVFTHKPKDKTTPWDGLFRPKILYQSTSLPAFLIPFQVDLTVYSLLAFNTYSKLSSLPTFG